MTDAAWMRRLAHCARRLGWTARYLAAQSDDQWEYTRIVLHAEDASDRLLADMVDLLLSWELSEAQYGLDTASMVDVAIGDE